MLALAGPGPGKRVRGPVSPHQQTMGGRDASRKEHPLGVGAKLKKRSSPPCVATGAVMGQAGGRREPWVGWRGILRTLPRLFQEA